MRMKKIIFSLILGTLACLTACNKVEPPVLATAVTMDEVTMDAIHCSATVVEGDISDCGFYYGTAKSNVTGRKSKKVQGTYDAGLIKATITGLDPNTTYYVMGYGMNESGEGTTEVAQVKTSSRMPGADDNGYPNINK